LKEDVDEDGNIKPDVEANVPLDQRKHEERERHAQIEHPAADESGEKDSAEAQVKRGDGKVEAQTSPDDVD